MFANDFLKIIDASGIHFAAGVPDSLLNDVCCELSETWNGRHVVAANEGNAIALAAGYYLATGKPGLVYMQNSGLGNCINPLLSLTDSAVYNIPTLLLIGWRGKPGAHDEPQHITQGVATLPLLDCAKVPFEMLDSSPSGFRFQMHRISRKIETEQSPFALIVSPGDFEKNRTIFNSCHSFSDFSREWAIEQILKQLPPDAVLVSTTGKISREVYELQKKFNLFKKNVFLTVGSMGHASSIAMGIAIAQQNRLVVCLDGDGAMLMHLGAVLVNATQPLTNFKHIVLNNGAHDSVGGAATAMKKETPSLVASACGYTFSESVFYSTDLDNALIRFFRFPGQAFLNVGVQQGSRANLGRPVETPIENKKKFMDFLKEPQIFKGLGALNNLPEIVQRTNALRILCFTGKQSGAKWRLRISKMLPNTLIEWFSDFSVNPQQEDLDRALNILSGRYDLIIGCGGGSVLDFAKLFRFHKVLQDPCNNLFGCNWEKIKELPLIAIPTTAGSGAEMTCFAVVYRNKIKKSVQNSHMGPNYVILDAELLLTLSQYQRAVSACDVVAHCLESFWSIHSSAESCEYATQALTLWRENSLNFILDPDISNASKMLEASNLAGKSINIAKTTVSHALSYYMTMHNQLAHGHAVLLTLGALMDFNNAAQDEKILDSRGIEYHRKQMRELHEILKIPEGCASAFFKKFGDDIGLELNAAKLQIDVDACVAEVNLERLNNNPVRVEKDDLVSFF